MMQAQKEKQQAAGLFCHVTTYKQSFKRAVKLFNMGFVSDFV